MELMIVYSVVTALLFAVGAWMFAPPVGGAWYPYIRAIAALVAAFVGMNIGMLFAIATGAAMEV